MINLRLGELSGATQIDLISVLVPEIVHNALEVGTRSEYLVGQLSVMN